MRRLRDLAADLALAGTVVVLWALPVLPRIATRLRDGYDALLQAWALAWIRHALATAPLHVMDANAFAPLPRALAYSDPLLGYGLLSVPFGLLRPVLAFNLTALLATALSLFAVVRLARSLGASRAAAVVGGAAACLGGLAAKDLGYVALAAWGGIALLVLAWRRFLKGGATRDAVLLGLAAGGLGLFSLQVLAFGGVAVALLALLDLARRGDRWTARFAARLALAAALALAILSPAAIALLAVRRAEGLRHPIEEMLRQSALPRDWAATLRPGAVALVLALAGLAAARWKRPPLLLAGSVLAFAGFALSFGPRGPGWLLVHGPAAWLFGSLRAYSRFAFVFGIGLALLAAAGLDAIASLAKGRAARAALVAAAAILVAFDARRSVGAVSLEFAPEPPTATDRLVAGLPPPLLHLPFPARAFDARWLFASIPAFRPVVNGYASFIPRGHEALAADLWGRELGAPMLARLRAWPVGTLVVHEHALPAPTLAPTLRMAAVGLRAGTLTLVAEVPHGAGVDDVLVFPGAESPRADAAPLLARAAAAADVPDAPESDFLASIDDPGEGATIHGALLVRGWSRTEAGPTAVADVTIDGERRPALSSSRTPRPDACAAFPKLGDCREAGYEIRFAFALADAGPRVLRVVFTTPDGRVRTLVRPFVWLP